MSNLFKHSKKLTSSLILSLISFSIMANPYSVAALAQQEIKNPKHVKMLVALAGSGNISAQYNLANHYEKGKGIAQDKAQAKDWLRDASRSGMIQAYLRMNSKAIAPANGAKPIIKEGPLGWLRRQSAEMYTIQIASSGSEKAMRKYYEENSLANQPGIFHYLRSTNDGYAMIHGAFKTVSAAKAALAKLPPELRAQSPWIRRIKSFKEINL